MLKVVKRPYFSSSRTATAVVEYFVGYEIVNDKVVKNHVSFYVYGPGEFKWDEWMREWHTDSGKHPVYKPSEVARLVNKFTGSSINYEPIRSMVNDILENLQRQLDHKLFQEEKVKVESDINNEVTEAIRNIMKRHGLTFNQEEDEFRGYEDSYDITTYMFKGESHGHDYTVYLDGVLEHAYETLKNE